MNFQQRIDAFVKLGQFFEQSITVADHPVFYKAYTQNPWFTIHHIKQSVQAWADNLRSSKLNEWLETYTIPEPRPKTIAIIMAGNIPLVGFHDLLCVLVTGNKALVKVSVDDSTLMKWVITELIQIEPGFSSLIEISENRLPQGFDAVIATGSNNSNRYFEYYFREKHSLLRGNRNSVAVLTGNETPEDIHKLGGDIFTYFGLGCRNVSKIYVPKDYDITQFLDGIESHNDVINHHKYANNYTYHKAILLMNLTPHLDNNFLLLKEDERIASPLGMLYYERYDSIETLMETFKQKQSEIQCIVSKSVFPGAIPLGKAQQPELKDYADGVDTLAFLLELAG
ncbi:MAG: acyl-CoA reductase [Bacteroidota bacterium]